MLRFMLFGLASLVACSAMADECHLTTYGTLPVEMMANRATTVVKINGQDARFILDTGASFNMMSSANAASLGLKLEPAPMGFRISGVGGSASVQQTHVKDFGILGSSLPKVAFIVGGTDAGMGLLGANLLDIADLEIDLAHGKLSLFQPEHCEKTSLALWAKDGNYNLADLESGEDRNDRRTFVKVIINGKPVRALIDTGAVATMIGRAAAERVGLDLQSPDAKVGSSSYGIGAKSLKTWTVKVDTFSVGSETIQHSQMQVLDGAFGDRTEMLLGVDFVLAHHMFIANSKKKLYFTYNGGRVFTYADAPDGGDKPDASASAHGGSDAVKSAGDYALRGQALLARGEAVAAVAALNEAIRLAPDQASYYVARAMAHDAAQQGDAELADLDKALSLDPKNADALLQRAQHRLALKDRAGASADVAAAQVLAPAGSADARWVARLYLELDQPAAALPLLDDWIRLHGNDALLGSALNERCWARGLSNQMLDEALKDCRKAIRRDGEHAGYLDSLGLVEFRLGHYPESIKAYEQALAKEPKQAWSRYGLGLAKIRAGQVDAGKADLVAAHAIDAQIDEQTAKYGLVAGGP